MSKEEEIANKKKGKKEKREKKIKEEAYQKGWMAEANFQTDWMAVAGQPIRCDRSVKAQAATCWPY
jgi:hypothetical protein